MPTLKHRLGFAVLLGERAPSGTDKQDPSRLEPPHNRNPAQSLEKHSCPDHHHLTAHCPPRTELCHNSFTTPNPILCSKKQQRTPQKANATSQNSSIPSQTSSVPLQLPASEQTICKACHASNLSLLHRLGPCMASQCQGL